MTSAVWVISNPRGRVWGALPLALPVIFTYGKTAFVFLRWCQHFTHGIVFLSCPPTLLRYSYFIFWVGGGGWIECGLYICVLSDCSVGTKAGNRTTQKNKELITFSFTLFLVCIGQSHGWHLITAAASLLMLFWCFVDRASHYNPGNWPICTNSCFIMSSLQTCTCFEHNCAHHQEVKIVLYSIWYHHTETSE